MGLFWCWAPLFGTICSARVGWYMITKSKVLHPEWPVLPVPCLPVRLRSPWEGCLPHVPWWWLAHILFILQGDCDTGSERCEAASPVHVPRLQPPAEALLATTFFATWIICLASSGIKGLCFKTNLGQYPVLVQRGGWETDHFFSSLVPCCILQQPWLQG